MLEFVDAVRPSFDPAELEMQFLLPTSVDRGDLLYLVLVHPSADTPTPPDGWTALASDGDSSSTVSTFIRRVENGEPSSVACDLSAASGEWHGSLVVMRGGGLTDLLEEARATTAFAAVTSLPGAEVTCLQAIDLLVAIWTSDGAEVPAAPAGYTLIDGYSSALVASRSTLFAYARANATGTIAPGDATTGADATGRSFSLLLRDAFPIVPAELVDLTPGNLGLIGIDNRPPRETP